MKYVTATKLTEIRKQMENALSPIEQQFGITITIGNMRYSTSEFKTSITGIVNNENGESINPQEKAYQQAQVFNSKMKNLGEKIKVSGKIYTICGWKPRASKYPLIAKTKTGAEYIFPAKYAC